MRFNSPSRHTTIKYRSFTKFNENKFNTDLLNYGIDYVESIAYPDALDIFYSIFYDVKHAPIKVKRIKRQYQPDWYSEEIKHARKTRDLFHAKNDWNNYKVWRNKTIKLIEQAKRNFYNNAIKDNSDSKLLWKHIKTVSSEDIHKPCSLPSTMIFHDITLTEEHDIINALNCHFINISDSLNNSNFCITDFNDLKLYLDEKLNHEAFSIKLITPFEVKKIIDSLNIKKATGPDGIGPRILKISCDYVSSAITKIINDCIVLGDFPNKLKEAAVLPLHKKGQREDPNNYRPISILNTISKIFERHVANQLHEFLQSTNILHKTQSGFRKTNSCQTALAYLIDNWMTDIDRGKLLGSVFLDLSKAFDMVNHEILLHKLKLYHFDNQALKWFKSYLTDRHQFVKVNNMESQKLRIKSGVPQGSILGPLLFLLYVNDLPLSAPESNLDMYADDSILHFSANNVSDIQEKLQRDLININNWCSLNNMALNPAKSTCMLIGQNLILKHSVPLNVSIDQSQIQNIETQIILGVVVDKP